MAIHSYQPKILGFYGPLNKSFYLNSTSAISTTYLHTFMYVLDPSVFFSKAIVNLTGFMDRLFMYAMWAKILTTDIQKYNMLLYEENLKKYHGKYVQIPSQY